MCVKFFSDFLISIIKILFYFTRFSYSHTGFIESKNIDEIFPSIFSLREIFLVERYF